MNPSKAYSDAIGRNVDNADAEVSSLKESNAQLSAVQLEEWHKHPVTTTLLAHLDIEVGKLDLYSENLANSGSNDQAARVLIKKKTLRDIINYATRRYDK
jgi:hypothetical protein